MKLSMKSKKGLGAFMIGALIFIFIILLIGIFAISFSQNRDGGLEERINEYNKVYSRRVITGILSLPFTSEQYGEIQIFDYVVFNFDKLAKISSATYDQERMAIGEVDFRAEIDQLTASQRFLLELSEDEELHNVYEIIERYVENMCGDYTDRGCFIRIERGRNSMEIPTGVRVTDSSAYSSKIMSKMEFVGPDSQIYTVYFYANLLWN